MFDVFRLLSVVAMTLTCLALIAPTALGQVMENHETLELTEEDAGTHCPAVSPTGGGCLMHMTSEGGVEIRKHVFGIESHISTCTIEAWTRFNEDFEGYVVHQQLAGGACVRQACTESGSKHAWPAHGDEDSEGNPPIEGQKKIELIFCIEQTVGGGGADESCETELPLNEISVDSHTYELGHAAEIPGHGFGGFRCEFVAHWNTEVGGTLENIPCGEEEQGVEVNHITKDTEEP